MRACLRTSRSAAIVGGMNQSTRSLSRARAVLLDMFLSPLRDPDGRRCLPYASKSLRFSADLIIFDRLSVPVNRSRQHRARSVYRAAFTDPDKRRYRPFRRYYTIETGEIYKFLLSSSH